jgi:hypothetical protein
VYHTVQESSGSDDDRAGAKRSAILHLNSDNVSVMSNQIHRFTLAKVQFRGPFQSSAHLAAVKEPIRLSTGRLNGRSARTVQQSKLDPRAIDNTTHDTAQSIYLPNKVPFGNSPYCGITRHLPDKI